MNVNVTLLFSVASVRARDGGLHPRPRAPSGGGQVAGPPLRRVLLRLPRGHAKSTSASTRSSNTELKGRAGLANARAAYAAYQRVFEGERFAALREAGAPVQRPLWASTGVKNPAYPTTLYVWGLVAPNTVNTMPTPTLDAARNEGGVSGATGAEDPTADLQALADAGIDLDDVTDQLLRDGIDAFMVPMQKLLDGIEAKRAEMAA